MALRTQCKTERRADRRGYMRSVNGSLVYKTKILSYYRQFAHQTKEPLERVRARHWQPVKPDAVPSDGYNLLYTATVHLAHSTKPHR